MEDEAKRRKWFEKEESKSGGRWKMRKCFGLGYGLEAEGWSFECAKGLGFDWGIMSFDDSKGVNFANLKRAD